MPYDKEIHFSVVGPTDVFALADHLNLDIEMLTSIKDKKITEQEFLLNPKNSIQLGDRNYKAINVKVEEAWHNALARRGWTTSPCTQYPYNDGDYFYIQTEYGTRISSPWSLGIEYDPHEVYDSPEEMTMGVDLSSRYRPVFLDMANEHGALGSTICLEDMNNDIIIAKEELIKLVPELANNKVIFRDIFY